MNPTVSSLFLPRCHKQNFHNKRTGLNLTAVHQAHDGSVKHFVM